MKNLIIFVSILSITVSFPVGSPLHKRERRRRQLGFGYGYGQVYPFYDPFHQPDRFNDFTPEIYINDPVKPRVPRPVTVRPAVTPPQRPTTSMVQPVPFDGFQPTDDLCPPPREDHSNIGQLPILVYVDSKEWSALCADRPLSPGQSGSGDFQPAFAIVPGVFLPAAVDGQGTQSPMQNNICLKVPDLLRAIAATKKQKDC